MKQQWLVFLGTLLVSLALAQPQFSDVPAGHWARVAINRLVAQGIIVGFPQNQFQGNRTLTRYEAALLIYRTMQRLEATVLTRDDLQALNNAMLELRSELENLGMRVENMVSREDLADLERKIALVEANQQGVDLAALQELRALVQQTALTASQALLQSNLALERIAQLNSRINDLEREITLLREKQTGDTRALSDTILALRSTLADLQRDVKQLADRSNTEGLTSEATAALSKQVQRLTTLEQSLSRLEKEQAARLTALEARLKALEEASRPRFSLEGALAWRQGFGYALGQEGPISATERVLGRLTLSTEHNGGRFGLSLYSGGGVGYTAVSVETLLEALAVKAVWAAGGEYAYNLGYRLGEQTTFVMVRGLLSSAGIPAILALPRIELETEGQWEVSFAQWSRLAFAARLGRESGGNADSGYQLAQASACPLESWLIGGGLGLDLPLGYRAWLRYSQLEERTPQGCAVPLLLVRPVLEARLYSQEFLTTDFSYRNEVYQGTGLGQTFTRNVLEGEAGFRISWGQGQVVPVFGYSRIWFTDVQGSAGVWPSTSLDYPALGDRQTFRLRLGLSALFEVFRLEAEGLWRNTFYNSYTASQYGGKGSLTWNLDFLRLVLAGGYYAGNNFNLLDFKPSDQPGVNTALGWLALRLGWSQGEISYATDTAGGVRFGLSYNWKF